MENEITRIDKAGQTGFEPSGHNPAIDVADPGNSKQDTTGYAPADDPLLAALEILCTHHHLAYSAASARQGLRVLGQHLPLNLFEVAASNLNLDAKMVSGKPSQISTMVIPYVLFFKNGNTGVVFDDNKEEKALLVKLSDGKAHWLRVEDLDRLTLDKVAFASPVRRKADTILTGTPPQNGHWLWSVIKRFWPNWLNVALSALIINLLGLALPLFVMNVYDRVIPNNSIPTLWALAAGVLIALGFDFLLRMLRSVVIDNSGRRIDMKVSSVLFKQALDIKMASRTGRAGDLANQIREFESVRDFFTSASLSSIIDLFFIGVFLGVLWLIVGPLAYIPMIAVPLVIVATIFIQYPLSKAVAQAQATTSNRHSILIESLVGIETIKAISAEGVIQGKWDEAVAGSVKASSATKFWSSLAIYLTMFIQQLVSVFIIVWGVFLVAENSITIGALIASNILAGRVLAPLSGIAMTIARVQQSFASLRQLNHLMKLEGDHTSNQRTGANIKSVALQFKNLIFSYPEQKTDALDIATLKITPGERVGIVGRVGCGKSTLGKLLCGLYNADSGTIIVDGNEIGQFATADLRDAICYVSQEPELFSGTLQENIRFSKTCSEDQYTAAINISGVTGFAQSHPHGFEMQVGERGKNLSGGQRQAVALARAMIASPKLVFLDEPTANMDNLSEAAFVQGFKNWMPSDLTLLVATHRHSLLELVDRIIILDQGKIIADGPRSKILKQLKSQSLPARAKKPGVGNG